MSLKELKLLDDIRNSILQIESYFGIEKRFEYFSGNDMLKSAVERKLEIIGEAVKNFKNLNETEQLSNVREIIGLRNIISHAYDAVDYEKIWAIVINHLPKLKTEVEALIKKYE